MNDADPLHGYRPSAPPADLRARILREVETTQAGRFREWLPALGMAVLIVLLYLLATSIRMRVYEQMTDAGGVQEFEVWLR